MSLLDQTSRSPSPRSLLPTYHTGLFQRLTTNSKFDNTSRTVAGTYISMTTKSSGEAGLNITLVLRFKYRSKQKSNGNRPVVDVTNFEFRVPEETTPPMAFFGQNFFGIVDVSEDLGGGLYIEFFLSESSNPGRDIVFMP